MALYRGRFAPSPTGPLHFGSLVAALGSYCDARAVGGEWLLRIEDVDTPRARPGAEALILHALERHGFTWDGPIVRQSARAAHYEAALARMIDAGDVFRCTCPRSSLASARVGPGGEAIYPGTCRAMAHAPRAGRPFAWRIDVQRAATITFQDRLQGTHAECLRDDVGDFVVKRADGLFAYQLAVVVDDALQGITDVVRGADLLASTARQIHLQHRLGFPTPRYLHLPVAINVRGEKLSKQTGAPALSGDPLPALLAAWRFLDQAAPPERPASPEAFWAWAVPRWNAARLPPVRMLPAP